MPGANIVRELLSRYRPNLKMGRYGRLYEDTTEFMKIEYGDVLLLDGLHYLVIRDESERSYGIEDPKYWVKRCLVIETGERRIVKLVFHESFRLTIGTVEIRCYRSPEKEARILDLVRGRPDFMQGFWLRDRIGNVVRVLEVVSGRRLDHAVVEMDTDHDAYFHEFFPRVLEKFIAASEAIAFLHSRGEKHGDIRRDHLWLEHGTGRCRWIDFDYAYDYQENPYGLDIMGLGSILIFLTGKGNYTRRDIQETSGIESRSNDDIPHSDFMLLYPNRLANLKRIYPYIPDELNRVLLHFSAGAEIFYETVEEFLADLKPCLAYWRKGKAQPGTGKKEGI